MWSVGHEPVKGAETLCICGTDQRRSSGAGHRTATQCSLLRMQQHSVWWAAKRPRVQVGGARGGGAGAGEDNEEGGAAAAGVARARLVSAMAKKHLVHARRARLISDKQRRHAGLQTLQHTQQGAHPVGRQGARCGLVFRQHSAGRTELGFCCTSHKVRSWQSRKGLQSPAWRMPSPGASALTEPGVRPAEAARAHGACPKAPRVRAQVGSLVLRPRQGAAQGIVHGGIHGAARAGGVAGACAGRAEARAGGRAQRAAGRAAGHAARAAARPQGRGGPAGLGVYVLHMRSVAHSPDGNRPDTQGHTLERMCSLSCSHCDAHHIVF